MRKRDAETPRSRRARSSRGGLCGGSEDKTLPLVVAFVIAKSNEAIRQQPSASVYAHKNIKARGVCT